MAEIRTKSYKMHLTALLANSFFEFRFNFTLFISALEFLLFLS